MFDEITETKCLCNVDEGARAREIAVTREDAYNVKWLSKVGVGF